MRAETRIGWAIIAAFVLSIQGWGPITRDGAALVACVLGVFGVVGVGMAARALRFEVLPVVVLQALAVVAAPAAVLVVGRGPEGLLRTGEVFGEGIRAIQTGTAPLEGNLGVTLALVVFTAALAFLTDLLAVTLARPAYALLTLLGLFLVPALGLPGPVGFGQVVRFGVGFGLVLLAASPHLADRRREVRLAGWAVATFLVVASLATASVAGNLIPVSASRPFGQDQLQMTNPSLDLKRNLTQGSTAPVLSYTTDQPTGAYLRMATLTAFDAGGFALDAVRVGTGPFPETPGLRSSGTRRTTRVTVADFESEWLPVPYAPVEVRAPGRWGFAHETLDVMAMARDDRKTATRGIEYEVRSVDVRPTRDQVAAAASTELAGRDQYTRVPAELPARIRALATTVTQDAPTAGAKALALEAYLRSERFRYSTAQSEGDSMRTLDDFLFGSRAGYCEQFAGSMVALARVAGLPARMAVGFTPGTHRDGVWEVSSRDMHTWPEIWLDGWGWVAFEPTPASGVPTATTDPPPDVPEPSVTVSATETPEPTDVPEPDPADATPTPTPEDGPADAAPPVDAGPWLVGLLVALGLAAVAAVPAAVRARRRASRLAGGGSPRESTLGAWAEVVDTASDLGVAWPAGSPRYAAEELGVGLPDAAADALRRLSLATEQAMFDRPDAYAGPDAWDTDVRVVSEALRQRATRPERVRATWWPRSLWRR